MAKKTKSSTPAAPAAPAAETSTSQAAPKVERGLNDVFKAVPLMDGDNQKVDEKNQPLWVDPPTKLAPQAMVIINTIRAAGDKGLTRSQLNANLKGVLMTRQPESRIVTYYQKALLASGAVTMAKSPDAPAAA